MIRDLLALAGLSVLGGGMSIAVAATFLALPKSARKRWIPNLVSFATGTLLATTFLGLIPEAFHGVMPEDIPSLSGAILAGILCFFLIERFFLWRHCHTNDCDHHEETMTQGSLILIGDSFHNFVDGILIAAAFMTDPALGLTTAIAVAAHEIPQELGDFAILLHSGFTRKRAFWANIITSSWTLVGAMLAYFLLPVLEVGLPYVLAFAASGLLYVAVADLIPSLHKRAENRFAWHQITLLLLGIATIVFLRSVFGDH